MPRRYTPACDFQVGEAVWFPVIRRDKRIKFKRGFIHSVHDSAFARGRGNHVNLVVVRGGVHYPTHSNLLRKTKERLS